MRPHHDGLTRQPRPVGVKVSSETARSAPIQKFPCSWYYSPTGQVALTGSPRPRCKKRSRACRSRMRLTVTPLQDPGCACARVLRRRQVERRHSGPTPSISALRRSRCDARDSSTDDRRRFRGRERMCKPPSITEKLHERDLASITHRSNPCFADRSRQADHERRCGSRSERSVSVAFSAIAQIQPRTPESTLPNASDIPTHGCRCSEARFTATTGLLLDIADSSARRLWSH